MLFEFDEKKSNSNRSKHGIDFIDAQTIWLDPERVTIDARNVSEYRALVIGKIGTKLWSAVFTLRGTRVRIISARRARDEERRLYESRGI
jgi:uncharacterized DUF497 family protein